MERTRSLGGELIEGCPDRRVGGTDQVVTLATSTPFCSGVKLVVARRVRVERGLPRLGPSGG